jgi:hypothetical protein
VCARWRQPRSGGAGTGEAERGRCAAGELGQSSYSGRGAAAGGLESWEGTVCWREGDANAGQ